MEFPKINVSNWASQSTWIVRLVVVATAAATIWAMLATGTGKDGNGAVPSQQVAAMFSPAIAVAKAAGWLPVAATRVVAAPQAVPNILAGSQAVHQDRGACTSCHTVLGPSGLPVRTLGALSAMGHEYRGICGNCHIVMGTALAAAAQVVLPAAPAVAAAPAAPAVKPPTEGEWLGLEVAPITNLTATQYKLAPGTTGVVVAEVEAQALTAGFKAGDVVVALNGAPVADLGGFLRATRNGTVAGATVDVVRKGQLLRGDLTSAPPPAAAAPPAPAVAAPPMNFQLAVQPPLYATPVAVAAPQAVQPWGGAAAPPAPQVQMAGPVAPVATEGEWLGLEVAPITPLAMQQYRLAPGTQGLVVLEAQAQAQIAGFRGGDVVMAINGNPVYDLHSFFFHTRSGTLDSAAVDVLRRGQPLRMNLSSQIVPQVPNQAPAWAQQPGVAAPMVQQNPYAGMPVAAPATGSYPTRLY